MKGQTISDWIISIDELYPKLSKNLHSEKKQDIRRLANSGLPILKGFRVSYINFLKQPKKLIKFLESYGQFVVRALPNTPKLPRRYRKYIRNYEQASDFLKSIIKTKDIYDIFITYQPSEKYSGMISLNPAIAVVELGRIGLDKFSHGLGTRYGGIFHNSGFNKFFLFKTYSTGKRKTSDKLINHMRQSLMHITKADLLTQHGYFEFLISKENKIYFLDYKINKNYLV